MNARITSLVLAVGLFVAPAALQVASASATPGPVNGCPAGWLTLSVAELEAQGPYRQPRIIDDPANAGNGDGYVCGKPVNEVQTEKFCGGQCVAPLYNFRDNNLTPGH